MEISHLRLGVPRSHALPIVQLYASICPRLLQEGVSVLMVEQGIGVWV